ncbi:MAG: hypothetical protein MJ237_04020 [bacterium]|nr:hypothetical protein [bacterium]
MSNDVKIVIGHNEGITQALSNYVKDPKNGFTLSGGKITSKEWKATLNELDAIANERSKAIFKGDTCKEKDCFHNSYIVYEGQEITFSETEMQRLYKAMGVTVNNKTNKISDTPLVLSNDTATLPQIQKASYFKDWYKKDYALTNQVATQPADTGFVQAPEIKKHTTTPIVVQTTDTTMTKDKAQTIPEQIAVVDSSKTNNNTPMNSVTAQKDSITTKTTTPSNYPVEFYENNKDISLSQILKFVGATLFVAVGCLFITHGGLSKIKKLFTKNITEDVKQITEKIIPSKYIKEQIDVTGLAVKSPKRNINEIVTDLQQNKGSWVEHGKGCFRNKTNGMRVHFDSNNQLESISETFTMGNETRNIIYFGNGNVKLCTRKIKTEFGERIAESDSNGYIRGRIIDKIENDPISGTQFAYYNHDGKFSHIECQGFEQYDLLGNLINKTIL